MYLVPRLNVDFGNASKQVSLPVADISGILMRQASREIMMPKLLRAQAIAVAAGLIPSCSYSGTVRESRRTPLHANAAINWHTAVSQLD